MFENVFNGMSFIPDTPVMLAIWVLGVVAFAKKYIPQEKWDEYLPILSIVISAVIGSMYMTVLDGVFVGLVVTGCVKEAFEFAKKMGGK